ncbi:MAG: hypothetical protein WCS94_17350 [Verrucomicrobiota bacterium]
MKNHFRLSLAFASGPLCARTPLLHAREARWTLPAGRLAFLIPDQGGWHGRVAAAIITKTTRHNSTREKHFGKCSHVRDHWKELRLTFRYDLPEASRHGNFALTNERTRGS